MLADAATADRGNLANFRESLRIQCRVIAALMMRELHTRYGRENLGFAWFIGEPLLFTFGVVLLWSQTRGTTEHGISVIAFVLTGYTPLTMWRHCFAQAVSALKANGSLLYHKQITLLDILTARSLIEVAGGMLAFSIGIALLAVILGVIDLPQGDPALLIGGWLLSAWYAFATALVVAPLCEMFVLAERLAPVTGYVNIPICGAFWMVDWLPAWLQPYVMPIPSVSGYEMIRAGYFGNGVPTHYAPLEASAVCLIMTLLGLVLIQHARRTLTVE